VIVPQSPTLSEENQQNSATADRVIEKSSATVFKFKVNEPHSAIVNKVIVPHSSTVFKVVVPHSVTIIGYFKYILLLLVMCLKCLQLQLLR
jgi:hypothetical protein